MSDNTGQEGSSPEDNEVIRGLRADLNKALKAGKTAGEDAVAKVKRFQLASSLMPEGFEGLADIFESEVDGDLTEELAADWLKGRGFEASPDETDDEAAIAAAELERVANLGGAVAAAANLTPEDSVIKQLEDLEKDGNFTDLTDLTKAIDRVLNG